ncbi:MAG: hypothetical protein GTO55_00475, partial [Armatimonadetes bacterium]|nr:hypothetical protein [Armatimonadota bacterium]NIM23911.1 hypothetical protein [Armatimonadota bacterium]NIM66630.1 hypothetical protein [Armatimonadota bacterium]NIM76298.1 hypothetical protein [Armatimonadota bacterium]NIN05992.1 hypothetical protein [Armatimonadota bacterium]
IITLDSFTTVDLSDLLCSLDPEVIERSHTDMLLDLLGHECSPAEYAGLCAEIASWAKRWQEKGDRVLALKLLRALAKEAKSAERSPSYQLIATSALGRLDTPDFVSWLPETIPGASPAERVEMLNLLVRLGENAGHALLQFVFNEPDDDLVRTAALAICQAAPNGTTQVGREKTSTLYNPNGNSVSAESRSTGKNRLIGMLSEALVNAPAERALRIITLLLSARSHEAIEPIMAALRHPQARVITGIMQAVGKHKPPGGERILFAGIRDGYWDVRTKATRALGEMAQALSDEAAREAVRELSRLAKQLGLNARSLSVRITAIEALGRLGREEAIPVLADFLEMPGWLFPKARARLSSTASTALANIPSPKAAEVLRNAAASRRSWVAKTCRAALRCWTERWGTRD